MNYYILGVLRSYYDDFLPFEGVLKKKNKKKLMFSITADLQKNVVFWTFLSLIDFAAKCVNYYILGVLMSYYDDFLPF